LAHSLDDQGLLFAPRDLPTFKFFKDFSLEHAPKLHFSDRIVNTLTHFFNRISALKSRFFHRKSENLPILRKFRQF
jgi:hypothetical protein